MGWNMVNKWIMVVDDEMDTLNLIDSLLRRECLAVIKATSAELALHLVKSMRPDAFVIDVSLPDMDGFELCQALRSTAHTASIPLIALLPSDNIYQRERAREAGADTVITKYMLSDALPAKLATLLSPRVNQHGATSAAGTV